MTLSKRDYEDWWYKENQNTSWTQDQEAKDLIETLAKHVDALRDRIDKLWTPEKHNAAHTSRCKCYLSRCCCAYDHPEAVCMLHKEG